MQKKYFLTNCMPGVSGKSYLLPSFITFESLIKVFGYLFGKRFVIKNYVI